MLDAPPAIAPSVDLERPSVARVYDYLLGGSSNWAIDRGFAQRVLREFPEFRDIARANRMFVNRVVKHLVRLGVRQFLDVGSGILSAGNTHQVADEVAADSRVIYVDNEPVAVAHAEVLLDEVGDPRRHAILQADLRYPDALWTDALATGVFDLGKPIAMLMFSVLHVIKPAPDGNDIGARSLARYRELLPTGSYLGISHVTDDGIPDELAPKLRTLKELCDRWCASDVHCRSQPMIEALLGDFKRIEPGMVWVPEWHPEEEDHPVPLTSPSHAVVWAGVGKKLG
jgi:S-adenosyl methyltransferase